MIQYCHVCYRQFTGDLCDSCYPLGRGGPMDCSEKVSIGCLVELETWAEKRKIDA